MGMLRFRCGRRGRGKRALVALVALLLVARGGLAAAGDGTCDADAKGAIAAGKKLSDELLAMHDVESLGSVGDVLRTWRLVRNQQQQVEESFEQVNTRFSGAVRRLSGVKTIKTDDKKRVETLFLGGDPFFVQCGSPTDQLHRTFMDAAADLSGAGVTPAVIDCNGKLPSGKTVKERFFKDKTLDEPVFFVVANRLPPRPFSIKSHVTPEMLVSFASNVTAVKVSRITDADEFRENCLRRKQCALVIFDGNYTEAEAAAVKTVAAQYRGIAMAEMDSRKLRLSIEDALPPNKGEPRLVYLSLDTSTKDEKKKGDTTSKKKPELKYQGKAFKGARWDDKALADFLESVSSGGTKLAKLKTLPQVFDRKEEERAERKKKEKADKKSKKKESPYDHVKDDDSSTKKKGTAKKGTGTKAGGHRESTAKRTSRGTKARKVWSPEEQIKAEQEERERERRRREQMMQEAEAADGIEYVGEDVSEVDLEEEEGDARPRRDPLDDDEEEEVEEIVVDEDESDAGERGERGQELDGDGEDGEDEGDGESTLRPGPGGKQDESGKAEEMSEKRADKHGEDRKEGVGVDDKKSWFW